jgi:tRNA(fMet)-specific endonuclease VapC
MAIIIVDTNILSDLFRPVPEVVKLINNSEKVLVPFTVVGEMLSGFRRGNKLEKNMLVWDEFIKDSSVEVIGATKKTGEIYGEIHSYLVKKGRPIPINDVWIAAVCIEHDIQLLTRDSDFQHLPQLRLVAI